MGRLSLIIACIAVCAALQNPDKAQAQIQTPHGLVVVVTTSDLADPSWHRALDNQNINGIALQIHWSDIEPAEGKPDWSKLDQLFSAAQASKKWVQLLVFPGFFTPDWALEGVQTESFPYQYGPGAGTVGKLPMPWDTVYLDRWFEFLKQLSARYGDSPAFAVMAADGPTSVSAEFTLPNSPQDLRTWRSDGYTPAKFIGAWRKVFREVASDFPRQIVSLSQGGGLGINNRSRPDRTQNEKTRDAIVQAAMATLGDRMALQLSDVHAGAGPHSPNSEAEDQFVIGYIGRVVTGFQLRTSAEGGSDVMGAPGDPPLALKRSLDLALTPNDAGRHVDYVEVYERDVLAAEQQPALHDAAARFH
jgi:hypothetical protein